MPRSDLKGLKISPAQIEGFSGVPFHALFRPLDKANIKRRLWNFKVFWRTAILLSFVNLVVKAVASISLVSVILRLFSLLEIPFILEWLVIALVAALHQYYWIQKTKQLTILQHLIIETERFNALVQAIEINDQLEDAGNRDLQLQERDTLIQGLQLTRDDLIRAFKTERILRENHQFMADHAELFSGDIASITTLQLNEKATEQSRILREALRIALDVQTEMRKLRNRLPG